MAPNETELRKIIKESVQETLSGLGFDLEHKHQLQADLVHLRKMRITSEDIGKRFRQAFITALIPMMAYTLWQGILTIIMH